MGGFERKILWFFTLASFVVAVGGMFLPYAHLGVSMRLARTIVIVSFLIFIALFMFVIIDLFNKIIKPRIKEMRYMWPIILMGTGVFLFVILFSAGAIWYVIQQSKSNVISPAPSPPPIINQDYENFKENQTRLNKFYDEFTKKQARLYLLQRDQLKLESAIELYEKQAPRKYNIYLEIVDPDARSIAHAIDGVPINEIVRIANEDFNYDINIFAINDRKYDLNLPFKEEEQIKDKQNQYIYRKARYEFLTGKDKINELLSRVKEEIIQDEAFIENYAKDRIQLS
jgi:hypothetical protein